MNELPNIQSQAIEKMLLYISTSPKYGSEIERRLLAEQIDVKYLQIINLMLFENLIFKNGERYFISPNGSDILLSGGWNSFATNREQQSSLVKRKAEIDLRNAKYALPISLFSLIIAIISLIYSLLFK